MKPRRTTTLFTVVACLVVAWPAAAATPGSVARNSVARNSVARNSVARNIDAQLERANGDGSQFAPLVDDATFLRRITLDLIGELPTPREISAFVLDPSSDKRERAVERLLVNPHFGQNWGRYWRDVILARRIDERALALVANSITVYMTEHHNRGTSWQAIATAFITANGDVRQNGATGVIMAQQAKAEETAAEVSRIFLGMQIQCAQCHDHPYDDWTRKQFHQLAAFFPRTGVRPKVNSVTRTFEIFSYDRGSERRRPGGNQNVSLEHYMSDLENPAAQGTLTDPEFFINGMSMERAATDSQRRTALAKWITDPSSNSWFAKAYVNRIWAELVGRGFYEPVDDLGPDREVQAAGTLDYLAKEFVANGHDIKWLFRTIAATKVYQRESRSRQDANPKRFAASCPQPLRADQLFNALTAALGVPEPQPLAGIGRTAGYGNNLRQQFNSTFGYDPSLGRDEVTATIPQVLLLMNAPQLNRVIRGGRSNTALGTLLANERDDEMVVSELYLRCLAREPSENEMQTCLEHVRETEKRTEAYEDIVWALINTAEFRHRR